MLFNKTVRRHSVSCETSKFSHNMLITKADRHVDDCRWPVFGELKPGCKSEFVCCLMTPGLSKDIPCHAWPYTFLRLQIIRLDIRKYVKQAVSLVIADGHLVFLRGLCGHVWVNILTLPPWRWNANQKWGHFQKPLKTSQQETFYAWTSFSWSIKIIQRGLFTLGGGLLYVCCSGSLFLSNCLISCSLASFSAFSRSLTM